MQLMSYVIEAVQNFGSQQTAIIPYACCAVDCNGRFVEGEMTLFWFPEDESQ